MSDAINQFYDSVKNDGNITRKDLVCFFVYFLTVECEQNSVKPKDISKCFSDCRLDPPTRIAAYLSEGYNSKPKKFIKSKDGGYKLERHQQEKIATRLGDQKTVRQTSRTLRNLEKKINESSARDFLKETLDCFEAGANRATVIMTWILAVDHLYSYIQEDKERLTEFNKILSENKDRSVKIKKISRRDDFCEIPDGKFIEFCKKANIISRDVKKILEMSIVTRNSSAHPSGIEINKSKVISIVEDLVTNVMLKYSI